MTSQPHSLPAGYAIRPIAENDADVVAEFCVMCEMKDYGEPRTDATDLRSLWATDDYDLAKASWLVTENTDIVALGVPSKRGGAHVEVHPNHRSKGLEQHLVAQVVEASQHWGIEAVRFETVPGSTLETVLVDFDFHRAYESWSLIARPQDVAVASLPEGYRATRCSDIPTELLPQIHEQMHTLIEESFAHWPGRVYRDYPTWCQTFVEHEGANQNNWWIVQTSDKTLVGAAVVIDYGDCLWINSLAVDPAHRGQGIGAALISGAAQSATDLGHPEVGLDTDSRTGAKDLYLRVGMHVSSTDTAWARKL